MTGATSGIGKELVQILYQHNAKIYLAARSEQKATAMIQSLKSQYPSSTGKAIFLSLDLNDLTTIKTSAQQFLQQEKRLDVLWNNAGVMVPPQGSKTKQGYELQLGTNCLAPFLFTQLLTPILAETAKFATPGSVRVVWVSSSAVERFSPKNGIDMNNLQYKVDKGAWEKYGTSKSGNVFHAKEYARRQRNAGIVSLALDPGNLKTDLYQHVPWWQKPIINLILKEPIYGAYTELYAGLSSDVTMEKTGAWIEPWGHIKAHNRKDIEDACMRKNEGGTGIAEAFWKWTEEQVRSFA